MLDKTYVKLEDKYSSPHLQDVEFPVQVEEHEEQHAKCKKHGIWCRAMTRLHLKKKKKTDKQKLFAEEDGLNPAEDVNGNHGRKRNIHDWMQSKQMSFGSPRIKNKNRHLYGDKETLIDEEFDDENVPHDTKQSSYGIVSQKYEVLQEITIIDNTLDDNLEDNEDSDFKTHRNKTEYMKKQWNGKRVKKARKRIRRIVGRSWVYFKVGITTGSPTVVDIGSATTTLITTLSRENSRRD